MSRNTPMPEFREEPIEVWSSVGLTGLLILITTYSSWLAASVGAAASFHLTHGLVSSWVGFCGVQISILAAILAWRGFGLNAIAALLGGSGLSSAVINMNSYGVSVSILLAVGWLIAAIHFSRRFFDGNPFRTFLSLWGLTFASSISQSILLFLLFDHHYPLQGVLLLKLALFGLGGLTLLFAFPRKNKEYII